jgi:hypothetical protein
MIPTKDPPAKPKDGIDNWWNAQFIRDVKWLATQPNWRQEWFESACTQVDHFLWLYQRGTFPMTGKFQRMCNKYGGCPYLDICTKPTLEERLSLLDSGVYTENTWSPLKH